ncbi:hypothetical protein ACSYHE_11175 [Geobacillus thermodenitrificans subsp. calidus]
MATGTEGFAAQLASEIWGHRFMDGQRGPEYVLEFMNVLAGTNYTLNADKYKRRKAEGFRRFVFEGDKEGSKNDIVQLEQEKRLLLYKEVGGEDTVMVIREFFRNLEIPLYDGRGNLADRSWYAKTLYPLHESLLFFELRRKKGEKVASYERNFFARGGELYYLMLSYGTEKQPYLRKEIEARMEELLQRNKAIEKIVSKIINVLDNDEETKESDYALLKSIENVNREYPRLPITEHVLFDRFAQEYHQLIHLNLDIFEMFHLLVSLVGFQLIQYMYDRTKKDDNDKLIMFFDCLDGQVGQVLKLSAQSFQENEAMVKEKFEKELKRLLTEKISAIYEANKKLEQWQKDPDELLKVLGLKKVRTGKQRIIKALSQAKSFEELVDDITIIVQETVSPQLKKHYLSIIRGIIRDSGMGGFRAGTNYRYFMTDKFLEMLVLVNIPPQQSMEFAEFLHQIYNKYGFVIGEEHARLSGLYEKSKLNVSYFHKNEQSLREKLKSNGLLIEYSDATAMIRNPYNSVLEKVGL